MIKQKLIELVQEALAGGDAPAEIKGKYHPLVIEQYLEIVYHDIAQALAEDGRIEQLDVMVKGFKVVVQKDVDRDQVYVDAPVAIMPLFPMSASIRSLSMYKGQQTAFVPVGAASAPIWAELEAVKIDPTCGYNPEGMKVYFEQWNAPRVGDELMFKCIVPFSQLGKKDNVFIPGGSNLKIFEAIYKVILSRGNRSDEYNDNNSTQTS